MMDRVTQFHQSFTRKAEEVDTRQSIQRHDPDFHKKKQNKDPESRHQDPYEDLANISVNALITFLEDLIDRIESQYTRHHSHSEMQQSHNRQPVSPHQTAAAIAAYQTPTGISTPPITNNNSSNKHQTALDSAIADLDQNVLKTAIRELHDLTRRGVSEISLERGDGFLESILLSIQKYQ